MFHLQKATFLFSRKNQWFCLFNHKQAFAAGVRRTCTNPTCGAKRPVADDFVLQLHWCDAEKTTARYPRCAGLFPGTFFFCQSTRAFLRSSFVYLEKNVRVPSCVPSSLGHRRRSWRLVFLKSESCLLDYPTLKNNSHEAWKCSVTRKQYFERPHTAVFRRQRLEQPPVPEQDDRFGAKHRRLLLWWVHKSPYKGLATVCVRINQQVAVVKDQFFLEWTLSTISHSCWAHAADIWECNWLYKDLMQGKHTSQKSVNETIGSDRMQPALGRVTKSLATFCFHELVQNQTTEHISDNTSWSDKPQASHDRYLSLRVTKTGHAQCTKRFRAWYNKSWTYGARFCMTVCARVCVCQRKTKDRLTAWEKKAHSPRRDSNLYLWDTRQSCFRLHHESRHASCVCVCVWTCICVWVCVCGRVCGCVCSLPKHVGSLQVNDFEQNKIHHNNFEIQTPTIQEACVHEAPPACHDPRTCPPGWHRNCFHSFRQVHARERPFASLGSEVNRPLYLLSSGFN